jgi:D-xylonolactonase
MRSDVVADYSCETAEGPLWDERVETLYWIGIYGGRLFEYSPATDRHGIVHEDGVLGGLTLQEDGSFLLFGEAGEVRRLDDGTVATVVDGVEADDHTRYNDCIADPEGRVFCGTKGNDRGLGRLYRLETDGSIHLVEDDLGLSNGLGFSLDGTTLYHTDSTAGRIYEYEYERRTGELSNRRPFVDVSDETGMPDGLTVDTEGHVWSARYEGGCVVRYAPDGTEVDRIELPVEQVTSVAFGGPANDDLYVTTAGGDEEPREANAGALFRLDVDANGTPPFKSAV